MGQRIWIAVSALICLALAVSAAFWLFPPVWLELPKWNETNHFIPGLLLFFSMVFVLLTLLSTDRYLSHLQITIKQIIHKLSRAMRDGIHILQPFPVNKKPPAAISTELLLTLNEVLMHSKSDTIDIKAKYQQLNSLNVRFLAHALTLHQYLELSSLILSSLGLGIRILDVEGDILFENETFHRLSSPASYTLENLIRLAVRHISDNPEENAYIYRKQDQAIQVKVQTLGRFQDQGHTRNEGTLVVLEDVTIQEEVKQRSLDIEAWTAISKMSAQVSHEIRNPLNAISLNLEMVKEDLSSLHPLPKGTQNLLDATLRQTERLKRLSDQYLKLHRIFDGEGQFDANKVIEDVAAALVPTLEQHAIDLQIHYAPKPCILNGDIQALYALIYNVIQNAIEEMEDGGRIDVRTRMTHSHVIIKVLDSGKGIPLDIRQKVFQAFFTTKKEGTGLGLAVAKHALHHLFGRYQIKCGHPNALRGTLFVFSFPLKNELKGTRDLFKNDPPPPLS